VPLEHREPGLRIGEGGECRGEVVPGSNHCMRVQRKRTRGAKLKP
jgi:hypothetical protein